MNTDNSLKLCESIAENVAKAHCPEHLCECIVAEVEDRAAWEAFRLTHLGRLVTNGVKVRFENRTLHEGLKAS